MPARSSGRGAFRDVALRPTPYTTMSDWNIAYGWSGHILCNRATESGDAKNNVIAIDAAAFEKIVADIEECYEQDAVRLQELGRRPPGQLTWSIAAGHPATFSNAYEYYGAVFEEAEIRAEEGAENNTICDAEYIKAMKERYGLDLPQCRLMFGSSLDN